ncbi:MAG: sensor histidine kinase [Lachnospiraceae bacterium]|nr:sensor histidine kinase [Lachnospiraceae bacterium]
MKRHRIPEKFRLSNRLTPIMIALIFIPIAIFSGVLFHNSEVTTVRESRDYLEAKTMRDSGDVERNIESIKMTSRFFLTDEDLVRILVSAYDGVTPDADAYNAFYGSAVADLERLVSSNPYLYAVRVYAVTDRLRTAAPILYTRSDMHKLSWYGESPEGWHFAYADNLISSPTSMPGPLLVSYVTPVKDPVRGTVGYIESVMTMETMFPMIGNATDQEWSFFTDEQGRTLFGDGEELDRQIILTAFGKGDVREREVLYRKALGRHFAVARYPVRFMHGMVYSVREITEEIEGVYRRRNVFVLVMSIVLVVSVVLVDRMIRKYQKEVLDKTAELRSLHNQINAHFIHNVLESIKMMAEIDEKYEISDAITSLGKLMRYGIRWNFENVPLRDELEYIRNYILLMNLRYDFEVILSVNIPEALMDQEILKMSLQPIVENAVLHGIEPSAEDTTVYIKAWEEDRYFIIEVTDSGEGMAPETLQSLRDRLHGQTEDSPDDRNGVGLKNVEDRIKMTFGSEYGIEIYSEPRKFTKVSMTLPRRVTGRRQINDADTADRRR